jgi:hemerythrin
MDSIFGSVDSEMSSDLGLTMSEQALHPDLLLGLPEIDSQHRALFAQLDRLIGKPQSHPVAEPFSEILSQLGRQIDAHFLSEESILQACDMPPEELAEHMSAHEEILEQYTR